MRRLFEFSLLGYSEKQMRELKENNPIKYHQLIVEVCSKEFFTKYDEEIKEHLRLNNGKWPESTDKRPDDLTNTDKAMVRTLIECAEDLIFSVEQDANDDDLQLSIFLLKCAIQNMKPEGE